MIYCTIGRRDLRILPFLKKEKNIYIIAIFPSSKRTTALHFIIFDIDGTLADTKKVEDKCFMNAFEETFGLNITDQSWEELANVTDWGITEEIILTSLGRIPYATEYETMIANFTRLLKKEEVRDRRQFKEVPGAKSFFYSIQSQEDMAVGIATGSWKASAVIKLASVGILSTDVCFSTSDHHKSREKITLDVIDQLSKQTGKPPKQVTYFGDGAWDYQTCAKLEIDFVGIDVAGDGRLRELGA